MSGFSLKCSRTGKLNDFNAANFILPRPLERGSPFENAIPDFEHSGESREYCKTVFVGVGCSDGCPSGWMPATRDKTHCNPAFRVFGKQASSCTAEYPSDEAKSAPFRPPSATLRLPNLGQQNSGYSKTQQIRGFGSF
jgi:hypothetical protein